SRRRRRRRGALLLRGRCLRRRALGQLLHPPLVARLLTLDELLHPGKLLVLLGCVGVLEHLAEAFEPRHPPGVHPQLGAQRRTGERRLAPALADALAVLVAALLRRFVSRSHGPCATGSVLPGTLLGLPAELLDAHPPLRGPLSLLSRAVARSRVRWGGRSRPRHSSALAGSFARGGALGASRRSLARGRTLCTRSRRRRLGLRGRGGRHRDPARTHEHRTVGEPHAFPPRPQRP